VRILDQRQAADAGTDADADLLAVLAFEIETGILERIDRRRQAVVNEDVEAACFLGRQIVADVEAFTSPAICEL